MDVGTGSFLLEPQPGTVFPVPTQVCCETNWVELLGDGVLNRRGEFWHALYAPPNPSAPAAVTCYLFASDCVPGRFAMANRSFYQIHADGTLWERRLNDPKKLRLGNRWHKVGKRSDWTSLCGFGTALGLTADGTVWTWGADPGQEGVMPMSMRRRQLESRIMGWLGVAWSNPSSAYWVTPMQPEPRPLLRILAGASAPPAASNSSR